MIFNRRPKRSTPKTTMFDNNEFAEMILKTVNSFSDIVSIEVETGKITISPKNELQTEYWYSSFGYDYMSYEQTSAFAEWIRQNMNQKEKYECTTYMKCGGGGEFRVNIIVPKDNNPFTPLKKW